MVSSLLMERLMETLFYGSYDRYREMTSVCTWQQRGSENGGMMIGTYGFCVAG